MNRHLQELYFKWLYSQIGSVSSKNPARTHWILASQLHDKEFLWLIPNDDNRKNDGLDLREEFLREQGMDDDPNLGWIPLGCSMLELLIALSRRLSFEDGEEPRAWFWELLANLGISMAWSCDRDYTKEKSIEIDDALDRVIWRTYSPSGLGGLFPLPNARYDQRKIELWYQLSAYLVADL